MKARGWGRLIFISSESAQNIPVEMVHYRVSKAALQALSRGYAKAPAGTGVTANAVLPGPTRTEGARAFLADLARDQDIPEDEVEARSLAENRPSTLIRRFAEPRELANLCVHVASPLSSATTGAALRVDGGERRRLTPRFVQDPSLVQGPRPAGFFIRPWARVALQLRTALIKEGPHCSRHG